MEEEEEVVYIKVFDQNKGDVVFEGKVSRDVTPDELLYLGSFWERDLFGIYSKASNKRVTSFKKLQNNVELITGRGALAGFAGVLYIGADDVVLRKSKVVPCCECLMLSLWDSSREECEKAFKCETLEELELNSCGLMQIPHDFGKMKKLKKLRLFGLLGLKSIPEEIGELSNLEELRIDDCGVKSLPKRLKELKLKSLGLAYLSLNDFQLRAEDLVVLSNLRHLTIANCNVFTPPFAQEFWEMIKTRTYLRSLHLGWKKQDNQELVVAALEENGSIVEGSESYAHFFNRNRENHERAMECVIYLLAIRRWRNVLNNVPKEIVRMIAMMLWITKCDVKAWRVGHGQQWLNTMIEKMKTMFYWYLVTKKRVEGVVVVL